MPQLLRKLLPVSISVLGKEITPVPVAKDLGVLIDQSLTYNDHVAKTTCNCLFKLKQVSRIKHLSPVVQKPINVNPRLKINRGVYFSTPKCFSTLIFAETLLYFTFKT